MEQAEKQRRENAARFELIECERMVQRWRSGDDSLASTIKLKFFEAKLDALGRRAEPVSFYLVDGLRDIIRSVRTKLDAAKDYGTLCRAQGGALGDDETRVQHARVLKTNGYYVLARLVSEAAPLRPREVATPLKRACSHKDVVDDSAERPTKARRIGE
jgi:hypothetical protein